MLQLWRLVDNSGITAHCFLTERDGRWLVFVRTGQAIMLCERCSSDNAAFDKADEIRGGLVDLGWTEPNHYQPSRYPLAD
jgi:hypothetical protein